MPEPVVVTDDKIVLPVIAVDDFSDKEAILRFIGAFIIDDDQVDAVSKKISEAYVEHDRLSKQIEERDGDYKNVPDTFEFIRDECGLIEFPRCGWLFLEERYLFNRDN